VWRRVASSVILERPSVGYAAVAWLRRPRGWRRERSKDMTEAREIRHSYGCVKETDMVLLRRAPKVKMKIESILGRETRKFCIAEVKIWSRDEEDEDKEKDRSPFDWMKAKSPKKQEWSRKVYIDVVTGTMYDFHTRVCLSSSNIRMVD
jgi:hypothetical protein